MIISHTHRYLFIEIPLTGSWAIHRELCDHYGGEPILHKHATYPEFRRSPHAVTADEYFVFATVRHPLDKAVSQYCKLKDDHKQAFSRSDAIETYKADYTDLHVYKFIHETDASFAAYFRRFYRLPFSDMIDLSAPHLDYVIRFEALQDGFSQVLKRLNIEQVRPVPVRNKTKGKRRAWQEYYTPDIIPQARRIFGPLMQNWGYDFPSGWGSLRISHTGKLSYYLLRRLKYLYFLHLRYNNTPAATILRRLRAQVR